MSVPKEVEAQLEHFKKALVELEQSLQYFEADTLPSVHELQPLDKAQFSLGVAKSVNSLFHMYLRCHGQDPTTHTANEELTRLKQYQKKVTKATSAEELRKARPTLSLNIAAANRFIDNAIPDLSEEQRQRLKDATAGAKRQREQQDAKAGNKAKGKKAAAQASLATASTVKAAAQEFLAGLNASA